MKCQLSIQDAFDKLQDNQKWSDKAIAELQQMVRNLRITTHDLCKRLKEVELQK